MDVGLSVDPFPERCLDEVPGLAISLRLARSGAYVLAAGVAKPGAMIAIAPNRIRAMP
jgi:hypothetical protein